MSKAGNKPAVVFLPGDVVVADIPDPNGKPIDHRHPAMIFRANAEIAYLVAISTKFTEPPPRHWIRLAHAANGHPVTGLKEPCVLKCDWVTKPFALSELHKIGVVPTHQYAQATEIITGLALAKKSANQSEKNPS